MRRNSGERQQERGGRERGAQANTKMFHIDILLTSNLLIY
jgi:hypothetical protein